MCGTYREIAIYVFWKIDFRLFKKYLLYLFIRNNHVGLKNTWEIKVVFWQALSSYIFYFEFLQLFFFTSILEGGQYFSPFLSARRVLLPVGSILKENSSNDLDEKLTARSCCEPLLYFSLQIDSQCFTWRSHIFLEKNGPFTSRYFWSTFIDFLIGF